MRPHLPLNALRAFEASARHLSFLETGRSKPSSEMVLKLAEQLEVPYRDRNRMLPAAGFAPVFRELEFEDPEMEPVREAIGRVLAGHDPYPAVVVDGNWNMVAANAAVGALIEGADPELLQPPVNVLRLSLHPDGLASQIVNWHEWRTHILHRLQRQIDASGDRTLHTLRDELAAYPAPAGQPARVPTSSPGRNTR